LETFKGETEIMWIGSTTIPKIRKVVRFNKIKATPKVMGNRIAKKKRKMIKGYLVDVML
tara:strand:+ start:2423 stop:2599 length:177 start_codon:yes stop_codon:yes gene_type:complete